MPPKKEEPKKEKDLLLDNEIQIDTSKDPKIG